MWKRFSLTGICAMAVAAAPLFSVAPGRVHSAASATDVYLGVASKNKVKKALTFHYSQKDIESSGSVQLLPGIAKAASSSLL